MRDFAVGTGPGSFLKRYWLAAVAALTMAAVFVPFEPVMPTSGLDPAWQISMNVAAATHMRIGRDLIFTFGPYAGLFAHPYNPSLDTLLLLAGSVLAVAYLSALLLLMGTKPRGALVALLVYFGWFSVGSDAAFFSYFLLLALLLVRRSEREQQAGQPTATAVWALLCLPFGLLPLIKGNQLAMCMLMLPLFAGFLLWRKRHAAAVLTFAVPIVSAVCFWTAAGQPLSGLGDYLSSSMQILRGYTEAMGLVTYPAGRARYIFSMGVPLYLVGAGALLTSIARLATVQGPRKVFLFLSFALFLFVGFKTGFVRYDLHALAAATMLLLAALYAITLQRTWGGITAVVISLLLIIPLQLQSRTGLLEPLSYKVLRPDGLKHPPSRGFLVLGGVYGGVAEGVWKRLHPGTLRREYEAALGQIRSSYAVPPLAGGVDIYPTEQSLVIASANRWDPRPVMQSYAAWTPRLLLENEQHLRTAGAPEHVLFEAAPIDDHLPSLEDGISWSAFLDNYETTQQDSRFVYLRRRPGALVPQSTFALLKDAEQSTGEATAVPEADGPVFAKVVLKRTVLGELANLFFKPTEVHMLLRLNDGSDVRYRVLPEMMQTGFVLSPLVADTAQFGELVHADRARLAGRVVTSMTIEPDHPGFHEWQSTFRLQLLRYSGGAWRDRPSTASGVTLPR